MSDRTNFQLYVYDVPEAEHAAALEVINDNGLSTDWFDGDASEVAIARIAPGQEYVDGQAAGDLADTVGSELEAAAPGATFVCWTDPAYEWLGTVYMRTPALGTFTAECDANGSAMVSGGQLLDVVRGLPETATRDEVLAAIDKATGGPWDRAIGAFQQAQADSGQRGLDEIAARINNHSEESK